MGSEAYHGGATTRGTARATARELRARGMGRSRSEGEDSDGDLTAGGILGQHHIPLEGFARGSEKTRKRAIWYNNAQSSMHNGAHGYEIGREGRLRNPARQQLSSRNQGRGLTGGFH